MIVGINFIFTHQGKHKTLSHPIDGNNQNIHTVPF